MTRSGEGVDEAVRNLRALILAAENYRQATAQMSGLGVTETQALSYLAIYGERGQNDLGTDLGISSGASTALVDPLERQGMRERYAHPHDRRRVIVRPTEKGHALIAERQLVGRVLSVDRFGRLGNHLVCTATDCGGLAG